MGDQAFGSLISLFFSFEISLGCFSDRSVLVHLLKRFNRPLLQRARRKLSKKARAMASRLMDKLRNHADNSAAVDKEIQILQPLK